MNVVHSEVTILTVWQETIIHTFLVMVPLSFSSLFAPFCSSVLWTALSPPSFLLSLCTSNRNEHLLPAVDTSGIFLESISRCDIWSVRKCGCPGGWHSADLKTVLAVQCSCLFPSSVPLVKHQNDVRNTVMLLNC